MFLGSAVLLVSICGQVTHGLTLPFIPVPDAVLKAEGVTMLDIPLLSAVPPGDAPSRAGWTITVDSAQAGYPATNALDGDVTKKTLWHSEYSPIVHQLPHTITIDTKTIRNTDGMTYRPRQDGSKNGNIGQHKIYTSTDGVNFGDPVAFGTWYDDQTSKSAAWETKPARYVRIVAFTEAGNRGPYTSAAEFYVYTAASYEKPVLGRGSWGPTIDFPLVPSAAAIEPDSGNVMTWSSYASNTFSYGPLGKTLTSIYNPTTKIVSDRMVTNTKHDMFCPGISFDATGRVVITGGNDAQKTSIYVGGSDTWVPGPLMKLKRGYQSQVTMGDGRIFTIGGSWSGGFGGKNGEIYNPNINAWSLLPQCPVSPMLTADSYDKLVGHTFRADNHGWLFNWKNGYVFQAGPSIKMNWYNTKGTGGQAPAGNRANDGDAMCGDAVMYDAVKGKILTTGGSPDYQGKTATRNAHVLTLGNPDTIVNVQAINPMFYARIFASSVVLPDGQVFITGGQVIGAPFSDDNSILTSELWNPVTTAFTRTIAYSIPRNYHSFALLLQDATVIVGGGGLCDNCSTNHFDAQIYTPPYLLSPTTGAKLARPVINTVSSRKNKPGATITVNTNSAITSFSLIRYSTATHTVNTDQRRVPMMPTKVGTNSYKITLGPADYGIVTPGYWMLFAINTAGVPSIAYTVLIA